MRHTDEKGNTNKNNLKKTLENGTNKKMRRKIELLLLSTSRVETLNEGVRVC